MEILYEDSDIIVIHKPAGTATETARVGQADCVSELKKYLHDEAPAAGEPYVGIVHRLDQPVEGILVFGKSIPAAAGLSKDIAAGKLKKEYLAVVYSENELQNGKIRLTDYLVKDNRSNLSSICEEDTPGARKAELIYECLNRRMISKADSGYPVSLLKINLITGRHHQIRVQLSHAGLPILGDNKYGYVPEDYNGPLCLTAYHLEFRHPVTRKDMEFTIEAENLKNLDARA